MGIRSAVFRGSAAIGEKRPGFPIGQVLLAPRSSSGCRRWRRRQSKIAVVAAAALSVITSVHPIERARAYDILDRVYPAPQPAPVAPPPARWGIAFPLKLRIEGGVGYGNGNTDTTISSPGIGSIGTDLIGGSGIAAEAALWSDRILFPNISLGAQYLHFDNSGSVTATSAAGPVLGVTSATGKLGLTTDALMFDAAWRPNIERFHPFLGAGVGVAFSDLSGSALGASAGDSQTAVAGQAFLGFDYDIAPNVYVGVTGRFFISEATYHISSVQTPSTGIPVQIQNNIDITNRPISLTAHFGIQF